MDKFCVHHPRKVEKTVVLKNGLCQSSVEMEQFF